MSQTTTKQFSFLQENLQQYHQFVSWLKSYSSKQLTEIVELENVRDILHMEVIQRVYPKLKKGIHFNSKDLRLFKLHTDVVVKLHDLKNNPKYANNRDKQHKAQDIRYSLFPDTWNKDA